MFIQPVYENDNKNFKVNKPSKSKGSIKPDGLYKLFQNCNLFIQLPKQQLVATT